MSPWRAELGRQVRLALPIVFVQLGLFAMGAVDGAFLGRVDELTYAGGAAGNAFAFTFLAFGMGAVSVLDPIVGQAFGARDWNAIARGLQRGLLLALLISVPISLCIGQAPWFMRRCHVREEIVPIATAFARVTIVSVPPFLLFVALRQASQAMHRLRPLVIVIVLANLVNAFLDWVWVFGNLGSEPHGAVGSAWATVVARWFMVVALALISGRELGRFLWPLAERLFDLRALGRVLALGAPIGLQWFAEIGTFAYVALRMGELGASELAGHQVAMHLASGSFMVPLGISMAAAVRVANEIGRGDAGAVRLASRVALATGVAVMGIFALVFIAFPTLLARVFTDRPEILAPAVLLIPLAGAFQVFDGVQGVASGVLRGLADTRASMLVHLAGFWCVAIPLGLELAFDRGLGARGLWWGLVAGLGAVALALTVRLRIVLRRRIQRVAIDHAAEPAPPAESSR
jgi:MATE family multidrug resistance protein